MNALSLASDRLPLRISGDGVALVGQSRVPLETVIAAHHQGAGPEEIARRYPSVDVSDVSAVIGFYLSHREEIDEYLAQRVRQIEAVQRECESRSDPTGVRCRLLQRKSELERKP